MSFGTGWWLNSKTPGFGGGLTPTAFSAAKYAIQQDAADVNILVIGDSTGNATDEWVYLFGQWLATTYPTHSVSYRVWNDATPAYDTAVSLGTGSGSNTIRIWNASISGAQAFYVTGSREAAAVGAPSADLIILNHGKNDTFGTAAEQKGEILMGLEAARLLHPSAHVAMWLQNPNRDDSNMDTVIGQIRQIAADYGDVTLLDAYAPFVAAGKPSGWYADNIHPNNTGTIVFTDAIKQRWLASAISTSPASAGPMLATAGTNLLTNGDFAAFSGAAPDSWSALSSATCSKELTIVDGASPYSVKIVGTTAGGRMFQGLSGASIASLLGGTATLAVRLYVPTGSVGSVGRISIAYVAGGTTTITTRSYTVAQGGWRWIIIAGWPIPANTTQVNVNLYCDSAANASSAAYYDRAILVAGSLPRDMA